MDAETIYLNYAGTSWPKPTSVLEAAGSVLSADPTTWPNLLQNAQQTIARFFRIDPARLLLTPSCTTGLSIAVSDHDWQTGDRVLTSHFEHHALYRTLVKLSERGVSVTTLSPNAREILDLDLLKKELGLGRVRLLALTAACNVTGELLPVAEAIRLAHEYGALVLIDGAQTAGWWDLDLVKLGADLFTFAGHKAPHGPWGVGGLYVAPHVSMHSPYATCALPDAEDAPRCATMPSFCDVGAVNLAAIVGLAAGLDWLNESEQKDRLPNARALASEFVESVRGLDGITLVGDVPLEKKVPTVAMKFAGRSSEEVAGTLRENRLITSGGLQCAPQAHQALGTDSTGVVRFSFGPANQLAQVREAAHRLQQLSLA